MLETVTFDFYLMTVTVMEKTSKNWNLELKMTGRRSTFQEKFLENRYYKNSRKRSL